MKLLAPFLCLVAALVAASATSSCSHPGRSQTVDAGIPRPSATSNPVNTRGENKITSPKGEAYLSGDIKVVAVELKEKNARLGYELEISYPQIDSPRAPQERKFNSYVRKMIDSDVKDFKSFCWKNRKYSDGSERRGEYHMGTSYEVLYASPKFLSINLTVESFTGYLNSDWFPVPLNYDLRTGRPHRDLPDLFKPRSDFLKVIASYCIDELMRRGLNCGGGGVADEQWLRRGAQPKAENYGGWNLTSDGVRINFGEYQIGAGCLGLVSVVVPYEHLKGILRHDVELLRPASA